MSQTLVLAADHAGYVLKNYLATALRQQGHQVIDVGVDSPESVDYPDSVELAVKAMQHHQAAWMVLCCGSGVGVAMAANRYPQLRAVHAHEIELARMSRLHNNTNTLCMGARWIAPEYALRILNTWRETPFEGGRHLIRLDKLSSC